MDHVICLPFIDLCPSATDQKATNYYLYHRRKGHSLEQCMNLEGCPMRNLKRVKYYSRRVEQLTFMNHPSPSTEVGAKAK